MSGTAKLIGHKYSFYEGGYSTFEVTNLKETEKMYTRGNREDADNFPHWLRLNKSDLGALRRVSTTFFVMYDVCENLPRFKELVIESVADSMNRASEVYASEISLYDKVNEAGGEYSQEIAQAFYEGFINKEADHERNTPQ